MATQSLYRRYRPGTFSELRGQQHVVRALRDSIANGREGQAYLFSGPRGTGKTTTARIMAKALNCDNVVDGEPCDECESCKSVDNGTSYDVHELDAASNNGVDAIRDLIEKASLGTPGRHKVYILDEVHMLSRGAEAALLKTLEEPPPHVVFVLATTDPQKMSDTIRSRTQHLQFHLLPADELSDHVRWVAEDAGLDLDDAAFEAALERGGGSARDTLSALELIASTGGDVGDATDVDALLTALTNRDPGAALTTVASGIAQGLDPRTMTEDLVRHLRNGFLSLMAPEVVVMAPDRLAELTEQARAYGPANLVRAIERLGAALTDMRNAPDPRVLVEVALVQLTSDEASTDVTALEHRLGRLEQRVETVATAAPAAGGNAVQPAAKVAAEGTTSSEPASAPAATGSDSPRDPQTGRKVLGGAVQRARDAAERARTDESTASPATADTGTADTADTTSAVTGTDDAIASSGQSEQVYADPSEGDRSGPDRSAHQPAAPASAVGPADGGSAHGAGGQSARRAVDTVWDEVRAGLKPLVRALYSAGEMTEPTPGNAVFVVNTDAQVAKCNEHSDTVATALSAAAGAPVTVVAQAGTPAPTNRAATGNGDAPPVGRRDSGSPASVSPSSSAPGPASGGSSASHSSASLDEPPEPPFQDESEIDLDELVDAPPGSFKTPLDHLAEAFPGSEIMEEER